MDLDSLSKRMWSKVSANNSNRRTRLILVFSIISTVFFYFTYSSLDSRIDTKSFFSHDRTSSKFLSSTDKIIANGTLGFGAIFALGLPDRSDKRDAQTLAASLTNLHLRWADGVPGELMNPKAIPPIHDDPNSHSFKLDGEVGCWRGHMNIMQTIVSENLLSALVMEDDSDWDVNIVRQMQQFSVASRKMLEVKEPSNRPKTDSPYGEGWDILWIGHCGASVQSNPFGNNVTISNDDTVPPSWDIVDTLRNVEPGSNTPCAAHHGLDPKGVTCDSPRLEADMRIVQEKGLVFCTPAYAVSLAGARKMLARLGGISLGDVTNTIDIEMLEECKGYKDGREPTRCLTVSPPYFRMHRRKGLVSADSDINHKGFKGQTREVGMSKGIVFGAKLNVENLIGGFEAENQYVDDGKGGLRYRKANEYRSYKKMEGKGS